MSRLRKDASFLNENLSKLKYARLDYIPILHLPFQSTNKHTLKIRA